MKSESTKFNNVVNEQREQHQVELEEKEKSYVHVNEKLTNFLSKETHLYKEIKNYQDTISFVSRQLDDQTCKVKDLMSIAQKYDDLKEDYGYLQCKYERIASIDKYDIGIQANEEVEAREREDKVREKEDKAREKDKLELKKELKQLKSVVQRQQSQI